MEALKLHPSQYVNAEETYPTPQFSKPTIRGYYSVKDNECTPSLEQLRYISKRYILEEQRNLNFDLNRAYEPNTNQVEEDRKPKYATCIRNISSPEFTFVNDELKPDFVCSRGILHLLLGSPYKKYDAYSRDWVILAMKRKGTIYLRTDRIEEWTDQANKPDNVKKAAAYGFKFEQYILTDEPNQEQNDRTKPVKKWDKFNVVLKSTLNGKSLLYNAEIDGVYSKTKIEDLDGLRKAALVEVKVVNERRYTQFRRDLTRFNYLTWWAQSHLSGIEKLVVGIRDENGICNSTVPYTVKTLPNAAGEFWKPTVCMTFLSDFLETVKEKLQVVDSEVEVYKFNFDVRNDTIYCTKLRDGHGMDFLPQWYLSYIKKEEAFKKLLIFWSRTH